MTSITKDVRPRAVLDEWLDRNVVTLNASDEIVLVDSGFVPRGDDDRKWHYLDRNLHDHIAAAVDNVSATTRRFLERAVHYDGISQKLAARLEIRSRELAMEG
jgi:cephalosporin-C deacetylase-like acetyl esterase